MPPLLAALPVLFSGAELGLGIDKALQGPPKPAPITTIPGSPTTVYGTSALAPNSVLGQIVSSRPTSPATTSSIGGSGARTAALPTGLGGGGGGSSLTGLPWTQQQQTPYAPGTPGAA